MVQTLKIHDLKTCMTTDMQQRDFVSLSYAFPLVSKEAWFRLLIIFHFFIFWRFQTYERYFPQQHSVFRKLDFIKLKKVSMYNTTASLCGVLYDRKCAANEAHQDVCWPLFCLVRAPSFRSMLCNQALLMDISILVDSPLRSGANQCRFFLFFNFDC